MKPLLLSALLVLAPTLGFSMCKDGHDTAMSCAEGSAWDDKAEACMPIASS